MIHYHINVFYSDEDRAWVADIPDLRSCSALGATAEEALAEVEKARELWLEVPGTLASRFPRRDIAR